MRPIITHAAALYIGAGLSLGLVMAKVMPLTAVGVGYYVATWPHQVYCAAPGRECFSDADFLPLWFQRLMFRLED